MSVTARMAATQAVAPGAPGIAARWTSSAKSGVGTALSPACRIWFTISHGILNEVYYPRVDHACTRDLGLIVCGPDGYFSEEKRHAEHAVELFEDGVPAYRLTNTAIDGTYRIEKRVLVDPLRPTVLQEITFTALKGAIGDYRVYALLAPHLVNAGAEQYRVDRRVQGTADAVCNGHRRCLAGARLVIAMADQLGRLCRIFRRLAAA